MGAEASPRPFAACLPAVPRLATVKTNWLRNPPFLIMLHQRWISLCISPCLLDFLYGLSCFMLVIGGSNCFLVLSQLVNMFKAVTSVN
ncbi:unnamed protein product, partial [Iphiclides podalirius]